VQTPSCERPKTAQQILFLSFEIKNCLKLFPNNRIASEAYEIVQERASHVLNSNIAIDSFPRLLISLGIVALFEKIYGGEPILTVFSNIVEDVQYCCFSLVYYVSTVLKPDAKPLFVNNY
jgi:hypothetical protein